ncbi:protein mono-ADP-ribosyltransferase PARP8-like isoform X2 [Anas acuta]|uniref:protein mono-ADP-ribosyltransferase PARP8-like isoform X2 n=1 Tax=Anas acuta TaxID=28680 RepID=UPI0035C8A219
MGICSRQERIQKDIDVVIEKCKAEKDYLFTVYPFQCMSLKTTQVSYDGELHKHPQLEADLTAMREIYGPNAVSLRVVLTPSQGCFSFLLSCQQASWEEGRTA